MQSSKNILRRRLEHELTNQQKISYEESVNAYLHIYTRIAKRLDTDTDLNFTLCAEL